ncbi:MAG: hypothetical protein QY314_04075 [Candidatus Dojkabacteria bacterium]|nr:MAG: hypothetical protein QY314_04075 [Candidatus Dojkabacteria bacterium]
MIPQNASTEYRLNVLLLLLCRKAYNIIKKQRIMDIFDDPLTPRGEQWVLIGTIFLRNFILVRKSGNETVQKTFTVSFKYEDLSNCGLGVQVSETEEPQAINYYFTLTPLIGGRAPRVIILPIIPDTLWMLTAQEILELVESLLKQLENGNNY